MSISARIIEYPVPWEAVEVLQRVQKSVPAAILAGGCIRDAINGRPINDIDIFVPSGRVEEAAAAVRETNPERTKVIPTPYLTFNSDVDYVGYYEGANRLPVNIIGVTRGSCTVERQLERFDFGICRVAFDGVRLWKDLTFDRDQRDQTFTLLVDQTRDQRAYSVQRFERLQEKYPGWKFVDYRKDDLFGL